MKPRLFFVKGPDFQPMSKLCESSSRQKIGKLRHRCWHASGEFIAAGPRKEDAVPVLGHVRRKLHGRLGRAAVTGCRWKSTIHSCKAKGFLRAELALTAKAPAL